METIPSLSLLFLIELDLHFLFFKYLWNNLSFFWFLDSNFYFNNEKYVKDRLKTMVRNFYELINLEEDNIDENFKESAIIFVEFSWFLWIKYGWKKPF